MFLSCLFHALFFFFFFFFFFFSISFSLFYSRKCHTYSKRSASVLNSMYGRNSRRTSSTSEVSSVLLRSSAPRCPSTDEEQEEESLSTNLIASRRASEDTSITTPRRRNASSDSKGSATPAKKETPAGVSSSRPVDFPGPAGRLRNHSTSSSPSTPKSPTKGRNRSPAGDSGTDREGGASTLSDSKKLTREEKKIAAYMRAFEMLEKQAQRKQEMVKKKTEERGGKSKKSDDEDDNSSCDETFLLNDKPRKKSKKPLRSSRMSSSHKKLHGRRRSGSANEDRHGNSGSDAPLDAGNMSPVANNSMKFPKTKKSLMNDWLSECVEDSTAATATDFGGPKSAPVSAGVVGLPSHYMRSVPPTRRSSCAASAAVVPPAAGGGGGGVFGKKRWLRQAISEEPLSQDAAQRSGSPGHTPGMSFELNFVLC